ncbi:hypothetical protein AVEN_81589-1 [Araneus ventricosus]|uniref:Uncharacterized protein n=1 Tax=Araneus ventricosus TaxID=182803 RepID=A0A4Y2FQC8_ARAVE|nr:hypothetical protein AVEN_81589-1 [Araneus ventricosus]
MLVTSTSLCLLLDKIRKRKYYKPYSKITLEMLLPGQVAISEDSEEEDVISEEDAISEKGNISEEKKTSVTPVVTKFSAAARTLDRFGISDRTGSAIVSATLQDVGITSESNVLNVADRNKIRLGRTKAITTLLSQVIKDYDHDQFGLYFDGRKDRTLSMEDSRRKVIIE